jgi:hypothetical protein
MSDSNYRPSGELQGDTSPVPYRDGGATGFAMPVSGSDFSVDATQSMECCSDCCKSDAPEKMNANV